MKKQVDVSQFCEIIRTSLEDLVDDTRLERGPKRAVRISHDCFLFQNLRFSIEKRSINVRNIKVDRDEYAIIYRFGRRRETKSYFYKTSLLLNRQLIKFTNLCIDELNHK